MEKVDQIGSIYRLITIFGKVSVKLADANFEEDRTHSFALLLLGLKLELEDTRSKKYL